MTNAEYNQLLAECNFRDPDAVSKLVTASYTNVKFNEKVAEKQVKNPLGAFNYFKNMFGMEVWPDGQGMDEVREYYAAPHIPFTFSHFVRQGAICDPNLANECDRDRCKIPEGGRGTLPSIQWFRWGFETPRDCILNIRHIRNFAWWAKRVIDARMVIDEQVMNMFYTMAGIATAGHKIVMQGVRDANGVLRLVQSNNPRNPLHAGLYNYMEDKFPQPTNLENIVPLTMETLDSLARYWTQFPKQNSVGTTPRGGPVYELWTSDDFYQQEALRDPDYMEKIKLLAPAKLFSGYTNVPGDREIIGNWLPKVMPWLPRFAPTADGRIVPVDTQVGVDIEVGQEFVGSIDFENAPFGIALNVSGRQGRMLTRPTLTQSGAGFPIVPITNGGWKIRNDYDPVCNKDLNKPYSQVDYEMGYQMEDPDASVAFLYRRRVFNIRPINDCDLAPIFQVPGNDLDCPITTIGCESNKRREDGSIIKSGPDYVDCTHVVCGNGSVAPFHYIIKVERKANRPDFNSLGCECGSTVKLFVYDEEGVFSREIEGVVNDNFQGFPYARYTVETQTALSEGECIKGISCDDGTPLQGNVLDSFDIEAGTVAFVLDSAITCQEGDDVQVRYYSSTGQVLGTINGIIEKYDPQRFYYEITSANPMFKADDVYEGQASVGVSCNEAPNASSSSSSGD